MIAKESTERRRATRYPIDIPAILRCKGRLLQSCTLNISKTGASIRANHADLQCTGRVELIMDLDNKHKDIAITGDVVYVKGDQVQTVGVHFNNPKSEALLALHHFLESEPEPTNF